MNTVCSACGATLAGVHRCGACGRATGERSTDAEASTTSAADPRFVRPRPTASPWKAAFLSTLLIGLGQMSVGQVRKGVALLIGGTILSIVTLGIAALVIMPVAAIDAYKIADKLRRGQPVRAWEFF